MIIKMNTIQAAHAAAAINYGMAKKVEVKVVQDGIETKQTITPTFIDCKNLDVNPLTGETTSAIDVYQQMRLQEAASTHNLDEPIYRLELRPPVEECRNWTDAQWRKFSIDCEKALESITEVPVRNKKTGKTVMMPVRPLDLSNAQVVTTLHKDVDPHLHKIINRHTVDGGALSSHYCNLVAICAANKIAEQYGWERADKRQNQRKERINTDALEVLKNMKEFNIEAYFASMRMRGWLVDPKYNARGNAVRYRIGEIPKGSERPVMYGASELGHGRQLTVSKLFDTWLKQHPEKAEELRPGHRWDKKQTAVVLPKSGKSAKQREEEEARRRAAAQKEQQKQTSKPSVPAPVPTKGQEERKEAIRDARNSIREVLSSVLKTFSPRDMENYLPEGIVAHALNMFGTASTQESREGAVRDLISSAEDTAGRAAEVTETILTGVVALLAPPSVCPSAGGGGSNNNDLSKKKDDDWEWWKKTGFGLGGNARKRGRKGP